MRHQPRQLTLTLTVTVLAIVFAGFNSGCIAQSAAKQNGSETKPASGSGQKSTAAPTSLAQGSATKEVAHPALTNPSLANKTAPEKFYAQFNTTKGAFVVEVNRKWSPNGADRFYNLVDIGYFKDILIFRAVDGFMFQFGIHGDPKVASQWSESNIQDDPPAGISNFPGYLTFAKTGRPNSRSAQMFINFGNNSGLDMQGFTPFGRIVKGMEVAKKVNTQYGETTTNEQGAFVAKGNEYMLKKYPRLDIIKSVEFVELVKE